MKRARSSSIDDNYLPKRQRANTETWGGFFQTLFDGFFNLFRNNETTISTNEPDTVAEEDVLQNDDYTEFSEDNSGQTPLHRAVINNNLGEVIELVASNAELDVYDNYGYLPVDYADDSDIKAYLLENGAQLPASPTELHSLALDNEVVAIHQMLDQDVSQLNALDLQGASPLHYAIQMGHLDTVVALAGRGAKLNQVDKAGYPPIFYAENHPSIKDFLLNNGVTEFDPSTLIDLANTKLHGAVILDDLQACEEILADDPSIINFTNRSDDSALKMAIDNQNLAIIELLLKHGADIEIRDNKGNTPLLQAVALGNQEIAKLLLKKGADPEATNDDQVGIIELAKIDNKHTPLSKHLKKITGLSEVTLTSIMNSFEKLLENELKKAQMHNKMPLIILGEIHGNHHIYQAEKLILQVAKKYGFETLYAEKPFEEFSVLPIEHKAKDKLKMSIVPVDTHPNRVSKKASVAQRNQYIAAGISISNKPGVLIAGADHLQGLLQDTKSKIDSNKYYLIPISLRSLSNLPAVLSPESSFARNPSNVVQIIKEHGCFSSADRVSTRWNSPAILNAYGHPQIKPVKDNPADARKIKLPRI